MSVGLAFRAFFAALSGGESAQKIRLALGGSAPPAVAVSDAAKESDAGTPSAGKKKPPSPARSDALTLLSTLQREARFLDLVQESIDTFEDAQIGAAAREVLRDSRKTLDRMFAIGPLAEEEEGADTQIDSGASPNRLRVVGKPDSKQGVIAHRGWKATRCEVPKWSGGRDEAWVLAPTEVDAS